MAYINTVTNQYPVSERDIRQIYPNTSFTSPFTPPEEYQWVFSVPMPTFDSYTKICKEIQPQISIKGNYEQVYELTERVLTQEEIDIIVAQLKEQRLAALAQYRYNKEISGIDVGGTIIKTDRESQATLTGAWVTVQQNINTLIDWKADNDWVQIDKTTVEILSIAVSAHVQSCFSKEKLHHNAISALTTIASVQEYDYTEGW